MSTRSRVAIVLAVDRKLRREKSRSVPMSRPTPLGIYPEKSFFFLDSESVKLCSK